MMGLAPALDSASKTQKPDPVTSGSDGQNTDDHLEQSLILGMT